MINPQGPAKSVGLFQFALIGEHWFEFLSYAGWKRSAPPCFKIDVRAQAFIPGDQSVVIAMTHGVQIVDALVIHVDQLGRHAQWFSFEHFTQVINVHPESKDRVVLPLRVVQTQPSGLVDSVGRLIKRENIIGHVHVSVVIDPLGSYGQRGLRQRHSYRVKARRQRLPMEWFLNDSVRIQ